MTTLYCAICGNRFEPDQDHVYLNAELKRIDDRDEMEEYAFHPSCWDRLSGGWMDPV